MKSTKQREFMRKGEMGNYRVDEMYHMNKKRYIMIVQHW
jgi:hypothetical protein